MRLCPPVSLCLAVAAALLPAPAHARVPATAHGEAPVSAYAEVPVPAAVGAGPGCDDSGADDFPLTTRLRGGPDSYRPGGGSGAWYLDLTNTTRRACDDVHPVVVLVDAGHRLKPDQPRLEFYTDGRAHPVRFEPTDEDELVGVFADERRAGGFSGFRVEPGRTLTVKLRLALAPDTAPNVVTANAAVVQRHGDDGDWVGQSNDYRFAVETTPATPPATDSGAGTGPDTGLDTQPGAGTQPGTGSDTPPGTAPQAGKGEEGSGSAAPHSVPAATPSPHSSSTAGTGALSLTDETAELARTGLSSPTGLGVVGAGFLIAGAALLPARRRR
jgi:hypothetical protein